MNVEGVRVEGVRVLEIKLHNETIGHLLGFQNGKNLFTFAESFKTTPQRPTFGLITSVQFPNAAKLLNETWIRNQRLHPVLSNLLPEGALRSLVAQQLKIHPDQEFELLAALGKDLPGAVQAVFVNILVRLNLILRLFSVYFSPQLYWGLK